MRQTEWKHYTFAPEDHERELLAILEAVAALPKIEERSLEAMKAAAAEQLEGVSFTLEVVTGRAVDAILDAADPARQDLVIMGTRGLSGLQHLLLGSVAEGVVRRSRIPVLTVRAADD